MIGIIYAIIFGIAVIGFIGWTIYSAIQEEKYYENLKSVDEDSPDGPKAHVNPSFFDRRFNGKV